MTLTRETIAELFFGGDNAAARCLFEPTRDDAALHIPGGAAKNPLTKIDWWPYIATMLDNNDVGPFEFDIIQKGTALHTRAFLNAKANPSVEAIGKALDQGATLRILGISRFEQNCAAQLQLLRKVLKREAFVNLYLTPPNTGGLNLHYDLEDSIAVQVKGEKIWKLYASSGAHKFPRELSVGQPPVSGEPTQIVHMRAGDVLYVPPGLIHTVETPYSSSQHVTFGVHVSRKVTMLSGLLDEYAASQDELRRPVRTDEKVSREQLVESADLFARWIAQR